VGSGTVIQPHSLYICVNIKTRVWSTLSATATGQALRPIFRTGTWAYIQDYQTTGQALGPYSGQTDNRTGTWAILRTDRQQDRHLGQQLPRTDRQYHLGNTLQETLPHHPLSPARVTRQPRLDSESPEDLIRSANLHELTSSKPLSNTQVDLGENNTYQI
jgi:hypothetical protein